MSTLTQYTHSMVRLVAAFYRFLTSLLRQRAARAHKLRSLRQLERLDDHLLDDIGLARSNNAIVPVYVAPIARNQLFNAQQLHLRTRARTQRRERQRHSRRRAA